jgi:phytoene synthase
MKREASQAHATADAIDYCHALVRRHDKDRYLASLFAPEDKRPHLWTLYALNYEIARIREQVSEPPAGELRLQWWMEALQALQSGEKPENPVLVALEQAMAKEILSPSDFYALVEMRRFDLADEPMPTLADLEEYLLETSSLIIGLAAQILAGPESTKAAGCACHAGVAYGIAGLLRALPIHRARHQCYVPSDLLELEGLSPDDLLAGEPKDGLARVTARLIALAEKRLQQARAERSLIPDAAMAAFLPVSLTGDYLVKLSRSGPTALDTIVDIPQWRRQITLWRMARKGMF